MNFLQLSAMSLSLLGSTDATEVDGEWLGLDNEIQNLATSVAAQGSGVTVSGHMKVLFINSSDPGAIDPGGPTDISGFEIGDLRLDVSGTVGDYGFDIETQWEGGSGSDGELEDAYAWWNCGENMTVTMGLFHNPFSRQFQYEGSNMLVFILDSPVLNSIWANHSEGIMLSGATDMFDWKAAIQNGADDIGDEYQTTLRADFNLGENPLPAWEGAYAAGDALSIGVGWTDDGAIDDSDSITVDARWIGGGYSADVQIFDNGEAIGDNSPLMVTLTGLFGDNWEGAFRYSDLDTAADTTVIDLVANMYLSDHNGFWQFGVRSTDSDDAGVDGSAILAGLNLGF